jgi:hypothetical protein
MKKILLLLAKKIKLKICKLTFLGRKVSLEPNKLVFFYQQLVVIFTANCIKFKIGEIEIF